MIFYHQLDGKMNEQEGIIKLYLEQIYEKYVLANDILTNYEIRPETFLGFYQNKI